VGGFVGRHGHLERISVGGISADIAPIGTLMGEGNGADYKG
jgi:hypothetical protein